MPTYPLTWASGPRPSSEDWTIENADVSGGPGITGTEQVVSGAGGRWRARLTFVLHRGEAHWMRGTIAALRGRAGTVLIGPYDLFGIPGQGPEEAWALALGLVQGGEGLPPVFGDVLATVAAAAALRATSLDIRMAAGRVPRFGQYVGVPGHSRLHVLTSVLPLTGDDYRVGIEPGLRASLAATAVLTFSSPRCTMRLANRVDGLPVTGGDHVTNVTMDLVEAF